AGLPDPALTSGGRTLKHCQTLAKIAGIETLYEPFLRPVLILWIGHDVGERNVQYLIPHQQPDSLESAFDIGERLRPGKWKRQQLRRVVLWLAVMYVQRMHKQVGLLTLTHQRDRVERTRGHIDKRRRQDAVRDRANPTVTRSRSS